MTARAPGWYWITVEDEFGTISQIPACWNGFGDKVWNAPLHDETPYQLDAPLAVGDRIPHPADAWPWSKRRAGA